MMNRVRMPGEGHEHVDGLCLAHGRLQAGEVPVEGASILVAQWPDAARKRHVGEVASAVSEIRMRQEIAPDHDVATLLGGARIRLDAGDAVPNVSGVGRLAHLAVADHVDAGGELPGDDLVHRLRGFRLERRGIDRGALFALEDEVDQGFRSRQAAGVGGEDAVLAGLHAALPNRVRPWLIVADPHHRDAIMNLAINPLIALGVLASTAATDAAYVFFNAAVSSRRRVWAANWSAIWYMLSAFAVISYTENAVYVAFAALGSWLGAFASVTWLHRGGQ